MSIEPHRRGVVAGIAAAVSGLLFGCRGSEAEAAKRFAVTLPDAEWRKRLSPAAYDVLRQEATERPGSSPLNREKRAGVYACAGCGQTLFSSKTKFESGTGWPSFWAPLPGAVGTRTDRSMLMARTEVLCRRCGGHLGHVFDDGPKDRGGLRYCINSLAIRFIHYDDMDKEGYGDLKSAVK